MLRTWDAIPPERGPSAAGRAMMLPDSVDWENSSVTPMIESYKTDADACYAAPGAGTRGAF